MLLRPWPLTMDGTHACRLCSACHRILLNNKQAVRVGTEILGSKADYQMTCRACTYSRAWHKTFALYVVRVRHKYLGSKADHQMACHARRDMARRLVLHLHNVADVTR